MCAQRYLAKFYRIPNGAALSRNGNKYIKKSARTAIIIDEYGPRPYYFRRQYQCEVLEDVMHQIMQYEADIAAQEYANDL